MQISIYKQQPKYKNNLFISLFKVISYLKANDFRRCSYQAEEDGMHSFDQNDLLLLHANHQVRKEQVLTDSGAGSIFNDDFKLEIEKIHKQLYGFYETSDKSTKIASTTSILINQIIQGNIRENAFMLFQPYRGLKGKRSLELEIAFYGWKAKEVSSFYANLCSYILDRDISINAVPTSFTWASVSLKYSNLGSPEMRFGAMGYIKDELLELCKHKPNSVCLLGVPIASFAKLLSR